MKYNVLIVKIIFFVIFSFFRHFLPVFKGQVWMKTQKIIQFMKHVKFKLHGLKLVKSQNNVFQQF